MLRAQPTGVVTAWVLGPREGDREREGGERWCVGKDRNKVPKCGQGGVLGTDKALPTVITWLNMETGDPGVKE